jgi:hypothetical protein
MECLMDISSSARVRGPEISSATNATLTNDADGEMARRASLGSSHRTLGPGRGEGVEADAETF